MTVPDPRVTDLTDLALFADGPPHELFARMRNEVPVCWSPSADGGFWSVTKAADIERVSKDPATFSSYLAGPNIERDEPWPLDVKRMMLPGMDPPSHTRYRTIVHKAFTPRRVKELEPRIRARAIDLLNTLPSDRACDFVSAVAVELPLQTIAELLGVPHRDRMKLFDWTSRIEASVFAPDERDGLAAFDELGEYVAWLVSQRQQSPGDDLISALISAEVDGERLDDIHVNAFFTLLMFAGNDTTRNTISGGLLALIENPTERRKLLEDVSLMPGAVEEMLRWVSAVVHFRRTATVDTEIRGVAIKAHDPVVIWYASGNRDEELVADPMSFSVSRVNLKHQAFGGGGRHFCLGAPLARLQLRVLFEELMPRIANVELAGEPMHTRSNFVNGLETLPIRLGAAAGRGRAVA